MIKHLWVWCLFKNDKYQNISRSFILKLLSAKKSFMHSKTVNLELWALHSVPARFISLMSQGLCTGVLPSQPRSAPGASTFPAGASIFWFLCSNRVFSVVCSITGECRDPHPEDQNWGKRSKICFRWFALDIFKLLLFTHKSESSSFTFWAFLFGFVLGGAGDWTHGLQLAGQAVYHWAIPRDAPFLPFYAWFVVWKHWLSSKSSQPDFLCFYFQRPRRHFPGQMGLSALWGPVHVTQDACWPICYPHPESYQEPIHKTIWT